MLELRNVHTCYGESHILHGITLKVEKGKISVLLGRNGMGKTTTIHSIIGFTPPSDGEILLDGFDIKGLKPYNIVRRGVALVPQGRRIFPSLTVNENLLLGQPAHDREKTESTINELYKLFPVLKERSQVMGCRISGGEQQMLAVARALVTGPRLLLMDEPFEGLAPEVVKELCKKVVDMKNRGLSVLLVEQSVPLALRLADHVYVINKGRVLYSGAAELAAKEKETVLKHIMS
jgi:branched-chain amino acid transport system ATP-binding protein